MLGDISVNHLGVYPNQLFKVLTKPKRLLLVKRKLSVTQNKISFHYKTIEFPGVLRLGFFF